MPNFKAEYTLEMVLGLIEADLKGEGFDLIDAPITFQLDELTKTSLLLGVVKSDRNAIPAFLDQPNYPQEVRPALLGPAPAPATATTEPIVKSKRVSKPPSEKELARRANLSAAMRKVRAAQRSAKAETEQADLAETVSTLYPPKPQPAISDRGHTVNEYDLAPEPEPETPKSKYASGKREPSEAELARRKLVGENNRRRAQQRAEERARIDSDQAHAKEVIAQANNPKPTYNISPLAERQAARQQIVQQRLASEQKDEVVAPTFPTFPAATSTRFAAGATHSSATSTGSGPGSSNRTW